MPKLPKAAKNLACLPLRKLRQRQVQLTDQKGSVKPSKKARAGVPKNKPKKPGLSSTKNTQGGRQEAGKKPLPTYNGPGGQISGGKAKKRVGPIQKGMPPGKIP